LEDLAHYVLECNGLADIWALYLAVVATTVASVGAQAAMRASFRHGNFGKGANYPLLAKRRRFAALRTTCVPHLSLANRAAPSKQQTKQKSHV
jgi:hypothetical protein